MRIRGLTRVRIPAARITSKLSLKCAVIRFRAVVLQLPGDFSLLGLLTAAPHGVDPLCDVEAGHPAIKRGSLHTCFGFFRDRKSTRLNSSHVAISYAVF